MKKSLILIVVFAFLATAIGTAFAGPFSDVPKKHWAYEAVNTLAAKGLLEGYADGKFKGNKAMTRYEMALVVARLIDKKFGGADLETLQKLTIEFADELALLGVKVQALEEEVKVIRGDMDAAKADIDMLKKGGLGKIKLSIEDRIRFEEAKFKPATAVGLNSSRFVNRLRFNMKANIDDNVTGFFSFQDSTTHGTGALGTQNNPNFGGNVASPADTVRDLFLGYVDIRNFGGGNIVDNFRIGRQTVTIGKGLILDAEIDGMLMKKNYRGTNVALGFFDTRNVGVGTVAANTKNNDGLDSKLLTVDHAWKDVAAGLYYFTRSNTFVPAGASASLNLYGLTVDGKLGKNVVAFIEYANEQPGKNKANYANALDGTAGSWKGNAFKLGAEWTINTRWDLTALYQQRDKDFFVLGINDDYSDSAYYGNNYYGLAGVVCTKTGAAVADTYNNSKIASLIIGYKATEKLHLDLWYEDFKAAKKNAAGASGNFDQNTTQLVGTYQYRENTAFKLRYRTTKFKTGDPDYTAVAATQPADNDQVRLDLNVKF